MDAVPPILTPDDSHTQKTLQNQINESGTKNKRVGKLCIEVV